MESSVVLSAEIGEAVAAVAASAAALAALIGADTHADANADFAPDADPLRAVAEACLDGLAEVARGEARFAALKARLAAEYVRAAEALAAPAASLQERTAQEMAVVAEVACVLTVSERTAGALLSRVPALTTGLPLSLAALQAGTISWQHARIVVDETSGLDPAGTAALEAHFLDPAAPDPARGCPAGELIPGRFRAKARAWRERHHPVSIEERHATSADGPAGRIRPGPGRHGLALGLPPGGHGRGDLGPDHRRRPDPARPGRAQDPVPAPRRHRRRLAPQERNARQRNRRHRHGTGTGGCVAGGVPSPRAQVLIMVPALSLLGATEEPAVLDGYGPIPPSMARRLVADGADSFYRVLTDPRDGAPLEIGRTSYRVPKALRHWLRLRDGRCPFPGCNNQSLDNEADHLLAWADGGTTGISNLGQPCRKHHGLKHSTAWTPTGASKDHPPGWTSPAGRHYASEHQDWEPPHWPNVLMTADAGPDPGPDQEPEPDQDLELKLLPEDPFPDWYLFTAEHPLSAADPDDPGWPVTLKDPVPECFLFQQV